MNHDWHCSALVLVAERIRGTNPCSDSFESLTEALEVASCCLKSNRTDLAVELLDLVETFPLGRAGDIAERVAEQRDLIAHGLTARPESQQSSSPPPLLIRGWNFATAMARHIAAGFARCEQDEIDARLSICQACPHLQDHHCSLCGCACRAENQLLNKLALKTERCPIGKWE